jgi:AP2-like factor, ANT lineage
MTVLCVAAAAGTQEEAAEAYDIAAVKFRGLNAVTNFDITRYDVDRIMASNTLLPGDLARRVVKKHDGGEVAVDATADAWKIAAAPRIDHDALSGGDAFSVLHDLVATAADGGNNSTATATNSVPMSTASSLATSLSNSREASPDRGGGLSMLFSKPQLSSAQLAAAKPASMTPLPLGAWPSPPPAVSIAHLPMFAAWTDA